MTLILTRVSAPPMCFHDTVNFCSVIPCLIILYVYLSFSPPDGSSSKAGDHVLLAFVSLEPNTMPGALYIM